LETNRFDSIIIAGDIGNDEAEEILRIANTFSCPVYYVIGNHDSSVRYDSSIRPPAIHIHNGPSVINGYAIVGYSGVDVGWGANQIANQVWKEYAPEIAKFDDLVKKDVEFAISAAEFTARTGCDTGQASSKREQLHRSKSWKKYQSLVSGRRRAIVDRNVERVVLQQRETGIDEKNTIFVSHGRTYKMKNFFPNLGLHLFGHAHGFQNIMSGNTCFVNVSALDISRSIFKKKEDEAIVEIPDMPHFNYGTYTVIEIKDGDISAQSIRLWPGGDEYITVRGIISGNPSVHSREEIWMG
jgi:predicted phosphodiesterase